MPIFMDVHIVPGVKARNVAEAHRLDLLHQEEYGCNCMTYWIDEVRESIFCLIEAPNKESVEQMHKNAHGLIPNKIIEVNHSIVESFLGRIYDPQDADTSEEGLKVFTSPSFRILLVTQITDPILLMHHLGTEKSNELLDDHTRLVRKNMTLYGGREVEHSGIGFILSFDSAAKAMACALAIQTEMPIVMAEAIGFKISINGGEPIEKTNKLFGDTIQSAQRMCSVARHSQVAVASRVKELVLKDHTGKNGSNILSLSPKDENVLEQIYTQLEENWQNPGFDTDYFCKAMAMSKSQLYRKTIALTGISPNILIKEFRLEKAKELMKKQFYSVSQVTFESGFSSPSYFTKCFKKKYGLLPLSYIDLMR